MYTINLKLSLLIYKLFANPIFVYHTCIYKRACPQALFCEKKGQGQTSNFSCAKSNLNEQNSLFELISIRLKIRYQS